MSQIQLIYASTASEGVILSDLKNILDVAKTRNKEKKITGFLCANKQFFLQCLEGEKQLVDDLFKQIEKDSRHQQLKILSYQEVDKRSFPEWAMGAVLDIERHQDILQKYNVDKKFSPYELGEAESFSLLKEFAAFRGMDR